MLLTRRSDLKGAAAWAAGKAASEGVAVEEVVEEADWTVKRRRLSEYDLILDALLGTGTKGGATGRIREAIEAINASGCEVVSVDIPSGLDGSISSVPGPCVEADATIALAAMKIALVFPPASRYAGDVVVADIGIPEAAFESEGSDLVLMDRPTASALIPRRDPDSHKGDYGHVLIVAGSRGKSGAAVLMARGCLRSGAGLVTVAAPASAQPVIAAGFAEAMTETLPETEAGAIAPSALPKLRELLSARDVLAAGPGLGTDPGTSEAVRELVAGCSKPMILDADALNILAAARGQSSMGPGGSWFGIGASAVLTPHPGEASRLIGVSTKEIQSDRLGGARRLAKESGAVVLLKGYRSLATDPRGTVFVNPTGNPGMATGGTGDVLSGVVAAWLAQGLGPLEAAALSAWVHGAAGDTAARELGMISMTAGDLVERLPAAYLALGAARTDR
jgi:NAD(P)H-hydrate epimerase